MPPKKKSIPSHKKLQVAGKIVLRDGVLAFAMNAPVLYQNFLKEYTKVGDDISATFEAKKPKRSLDQNNYMHLYFSLIGKSSGHTMQEIKNWAKGKILTKGITEVYGDKVRQVKDTADLNMPEMIEFMNEVESITEIPLPDPSLFNLPLTKDEYGKLKMEQNEKYSKMKAKL
jgi:hypothetical protein